MASPAQAETTPGKGYFTSKGSISAQFSHSLAGIVPGMPALFTEGRIQRHIITIESRLLDIFPHRRAACRLNDASAKASAFPYGLSEVCLICVIHTRHAGASPLTGTKGTALKDALAKLERVATPQPYSLSKREGHKADGRSGATLLAEKSHAAKRLQASFDREAGKQQGPVGSCTSPCPCR